MTDPGQGDTWTPGTERFKARVALLNAVEDFADAVSDYDTRRPPKAYPEWPPLVKALARWRELGRDGE